MRALIVLLCLSGACESRLPHHPGPPLTRIVAVPKHDIPVGALIHRDDLVLMEFPELGVAALERPEEVYGYRALSRLPAVHPIHPGRVADDGPGGTVIYELDHPEPLPLPMPGHRVDVVQLGSPPCVWLEAVPVVGGVTPSDEVHHLATPGARYRTVFLAIPAEEHDALGSMALTVWVRGPTPPGAPATSSSPRTTPRCDRSTLR